MSRGCHHCLCYEAEGEERPYQFPDDCQDAGLRGTVRPGRCCYCHERVAGAALYPDEVIREASRLGGAFTVSLVGVRGFLLVELLDALREVSAVSRVVLLPAPSELLIYLGERRPRVRGASVFHVYGAPEDVAAILAALTAAGLVLGVIEEG